VVTPQILAELRDLAPLAPLHQPHNLAATEAVFDHLPDVPQVACFETSFHRTLPRVAEPIPLPREICGTDLRRYGFHGLSYEYIAYVLPQVAPEIAGGRVIVAHLGNGASMCALKDRKSVDTTLGFTALDGLCMGTRPGSLDPGVILYLFQRLGLSTKEVETILYKRSGSIGISGLSNDMRPSSEPDRRSPPGGGLFRIPRRQGNWRASRGIGRDRWPGIHRRHWRKLAEIRQRICESSAWLGIELDAKLNTSKGPRVSSAASKVSVWVIPTDEELMIARHTGLLLGLANCGARFEVRTRLGLERKKRRSS
jgi:acetate kinase